MDSSFEKENSNIFQRESELTKVPKQCLQPFIDGVMTNWGTIFSKIVPPPTKLVRQWTYCINFYWTFERFFSNVPKSGGSRVCCFSLSDVFYLLHTINKLTEAIQNVSNRITPQDLINTFNNMNWVFILGLRRFSLIKLLTVVRPVIGRLIS